MAPTILITRPDGTAQNFADQLRAEMGCGPSILISPLFGIDYAVATIPLDGIKTLIFTSAHAVQAFAQVAPQRDFDCYTVGSATASAARKAGFRAVAGPGTAMQLAKQIIADGPKQPCLYLRGDHVAYDLEPVLNEAGIQTVSQIVYHQITRPLSAQAKTLLSQRKRVILPLFSPRSASVLFDSVAPSAQIFVAAMSTAVAQCVPMSKVTLLDIAEQPNSEAMTRLTARLWQRANQLEGKSPSQ